MSRFSIATMVLIVAGFVPLAASAGPNGADVTDNQSTAPGVLNDSEKLGREAQRELARLGCFPGDVNSIWGRDGRTAVKRFNQTAHIAWPDWPTADLVSSLRTYPNGYCQKCPGDNCATASSEQKKSPVAAPVSNVAVETPAERPPLPVTTSVQKPPIAAPVTNALVAAPVETHEQVSPPVAPRVAKIEPQATVEPVPVEESDHRPPVPLPAKKPADLVSGRDTADPASQPITAVPPEQFVQAEPQPAAGAVPAPEPQPTRSRSSTWSGAGGWPSSGPNVDGR
jgi:hypothetical protein